MMQTTKVKYVNCRVRAVLDSESVEVGDGFRRASISIEVQFPRKIAGKRSMAVAVELGAGNPMSKLKEALKSIEEESGIAFEAWEAVDITRQFLAHAQNSGFRIKGFPVCEDAAA